MENSHDKQLEEKILSFVSNQTGYRREELCMNTSLLHDLHLDGEDAASLILEFSKEFGIDANSFTFYALCFNKEGPWDFIFSPFVLIRSAYVYLAKPEYCKKKPLLIQDMYRAAKERIWTMPVDRSARLPWEKATNNKVHSSQI